MTKCSPDTVFDGKEEGEGAQLGDILSISHFLGFHGFQGSQEIDILSLMRIEEMKHSSK
jgi:hypothetical protein